MLGVNVGARLGDGDTSSSEFVVGVARGSGASSQAVSAASASTEATNTRISLYGLTDDMR
jgi:hypothetical protein